MQQGSDKWQTLNSQDTMHSSPSKTCEKSDCENFGMQLTIDIAFFVLE